jgi:hypothetical protein
MKILFTLLVLFFVPSLEVFIIPSFGKEGGIERDFPILKAMNDVIRLIDQEAQINNENYYWAVQKILKGIIGTSKLLNLFSL